MFDVIIIYFFFLNFSLKLRSALMLLDTYSADSGQMDILGYIIRTLV